MPVFLSGDGRVLNDQQAGQWMQNAISHILGVPVSVTLQRFPDPFDSEMEQTHIHVHLVDGRDTTPEQDKKILGLFKALRWNNVARAE